ncbi:MAG: carboxypeptidase-like regulatory domain-containing protein, partial [Bacteroidota bacterium]
MISLNIKSIRRWSVWLLTHWMLCYGYAQTTVSGVVTDRKSQPIIGASVAIEDSYDGDVTNEAGQFTFTTDAEGDIRLIVSFLGYETQNLQLTSTTLQNLNIQLRESVTTLNVVEVSASTFKAGDNSKVSVLKPLDIVTTAGAMGNVIAALQTLPGTQSNPEDGRLFVRGGEARETNIYVDGLRVFTPYTRTIGGTPSRGRFSPFLFQGVSFSTGGYSAAYGQSLSGILNMNTIDEPNDTESNVSIMSVGAGIGHTKKWDKQSISFNTSYINLSPYTWLVPSRADWIKPYQGFSGEAVYRYQTKNGLVKSYLAGDWNGFRLSRQNLDTQLPDSIGIRNGNIYSNTSYRTLVNERTSVFAGISLGYNQDQFSINQPISISNQLTGVNARLSFKTILQDRFIVNYGIDYLQEQHEMRFPKAERSNGNDLLQNTLGSFVEADYYFSKNSAVKAGLRAEYSTLLQKVILDPRITVAQKLSKHSQISAAYGRFTQTLDADFLYYNPKLEQEQSSHFLINYNYKNHQQILRVESYFKNYQNLLRYEGQRQLGNLQNFDNEGDGYAYGIDLFWRANQLVKNVDFWVSYSWIEHRRVYRNYPTRATPSFTTNHNLSLVSKIWIPRLRSQLGITGNVISGRPYENPNTEGFLNERSKFFKSINLSWAYLISQQKILFVSVSNLAGFKNEFGYEYGNHIHTDGLFP